MLATVRRLGGRLAFAHRVLWGRDASYRWAVLLGPPPLLGVAAALGVLALSHAVAPKATDVPWAHWTRPLTGQGQPFTETTAALPASDAGGHPVGFVPGWYGQIQPLAVDATLSTTVSGTKLSHFTLDQTIVPLQRILDAGPVSGLFVGVFNTNFVVRSAGSYVFSARLTRSAQQLADCLVWMQTPRHTMFRETSLNVGDSKERSFPTTEFRLQPGLLHILLVAGCWRGQTMVGGGDVTLMVRRPGQAGLQPAAADEVIRVTQR